MRVCERARSVPTCACSRAFVCVHVYACTCACECARANVHSARSSRAVWWCAGGDARVGPPTFGSARRVIVYVRVVPSIADSLLIKVVICGGKVEEGRAVENDNCQKKYVRINHPTIK